MMNVALILWTARQTGDDPLRFAAMEHCRTTAKYLVRADGSTAHEGIFDLTTGQFLRQATQQGWSAETTWSRGQAWALYGFASVYRLSSETDFLTVARACADYFIAQAPADGVPAFDFDLPADAPQFVDSSAAAIAASGLFELAEAEQDPQRSDHYRAAALTILETLSSNRYLAKPFPRWEGILMHGLYHFHQKLGLDESVAWGDHYFVEALVKALGGDAGVVR
jgi:unsaturated chondroitin disaccharide hydrolase